MDYELWLILLEISNSKKIKLIDKYKTCKNVYDNFEEILKKKVQYQRNKIVLPNSLEEIYHIYSVGKKRFLETALFMIIR